VENYQCIVHDKQAVTNITFEIVEFKIINMNTGCHCT